MNKLKELIKNKIDWGKYLFSTPAEESNWVKSIVCRNKGHQCGVIYYNVNGLEPDMRCKNCYDDLG